MLKDAKDQVERVKSLVVMLGETILAKLSDIENRVMKLEQASLEDRPTEPPCEPPTMDL